MSSVNLTLRRVLFAVAAAVLCFWGIWQATRIGIARTTTKYAALKTDAEIDRAVRLSPADAETHFARGDRLQENEDYPSAKLEFERAVQLRPRDYFLWMVLGMARDSDGDQNGALIALRQSASLAPAYARPSWQLGNVLLRRGQLEEAFGELRKAAHGDPTVWPIVIDLAWNISQHDLPRFESLLQPETDVTRLAIALFLAKHNQSAAAADQFLLAKTNSGPKVDALLEELLKARAFSDAYRVWARMRGEPANNGVAFFDGGFEGWLATGQAGFGWQIPPNLSNVEMSVDTSERHSDGRSLHAEFRGNSNPSTTLLTQLILVKPQTHYQITFAALSRDLVSAASPMVTVTDASDPKNAVLGQSPPVVPDKSGWRTFTIDLTTNAITQAIMVSLARQNCPDDPCPAFGSLWLDSFGIRPAQNR
ncbi:MAG: tetratricopeptide repeat protein [Acidobacteriota bacterium]